MKLAVVIGSRADFAPLEYLISLLKEDKFFQVIAWDVRLGGNIERMVKEAKRPDLLLMLGDRKEVLSVACFAHLERIPIAHIAGGDVTEGSYDDAMRDCISRMASIHFVTSTSAMARLTHMGYKNIHLVGNPGIDYIKRTAWKKESPYPEPYVVVSYQPETIDGTNEIDSVLKTLPQKLVVFILPNPDRGSEAIKQAILGYCETREKAIPLESLPHGDFLNLLYHCEEFIGNSSSMIYECPEMGVKTRMVGKRQRGRVIPMGDGYASQRIIKILKYTHL